MKGRLLGAPQNASEAVVVVRWQLGRVVETSMEFSMVNYPNLAK